MTFDEQADQVANQQRTLAVQHGPEVGVGGGSVETFDQRHLASDDLGGGLVARLTKRFLGSEVVLHQPRGHTRCLGDAFDGGVPVAALSTI